MSRNIFPIAAGSITRTGDGTYSADMGVDINVPVGTPCVAIGDGVIIYSEPGHTPWTTPPDTPNSVKILLDEPVVIGGVAYRYAWYTHLSELTRIIPGSHPGVVRINAGDPIGKTGVGNKVPHLHFTLATDEGLDDYCPPFALRDWLYGLIGSAPTSAPVPEPQAPQNVGLESDALLWLGSTGEKVKHLQGYLIGLGYGLGPTAVDGIFGPLTDAAVRNFQTICGLTVDGIVGPQTWARLTAPKPLPEMTTENIQKALIAAGLDPGPVDGIYGPLTEGAVREYQSANGLDPDGIVGPITWLALGKYLN